MRPVLKNSSRRRAAAGGFTLIELLVVCVIIAVLIAILIPSIGYVRTQAKKAATQAELTAIATGLDKYESDFHMFVPSQATVQGQAYGLFNRGSQMLAEGLTGYLNANFDGAGPPNAADPAYGFRTRSGGVGQVHGPYGPVGGNNWKVTDATHQLYVDIWGNEILYYRAVPGVINNTRRKVQVIFAALQDPSQAPGVDFNGIFVSSDNSQASQTNGTTTQAISDPAAAPAEFFKLLGDSSNTFNGGTVLGRESYLLVSAGPDGKYFTADDIVQGGH